MTYLVTRITTLLVRNCDLFSQFPLILSDLRPVSAPSLVSKLGLLFSLPRQILHRATDPANRLFRNCSPTFLLYHVKLRCLLFQYSLSIISICTVYCLNSPTVLRLLGCPNLQLFSAQRHCSTKVVQFLYARFTFRLPVVLGTERDNFGLGSHTTTDDYSPLTVRKPPVPSQFYLSPHGGLQPIRNGTYMCQPTFGWLRSV